MRLGDIFKGGDAGRDGTRQGAQKAVVTFHTTCDAMAFESCARANAIPGRLTTIPRQITAGCGYAWTAESRTCDTSAEELAAALQAAVATHGLEHEAIHLL